MLQDMTSPPDDGSVQAGGAEAPADSNCERSDSNSNADRGANAAGEVCSSGDVESSSPSCLGSANSESNGTTHQQNPCTPTPKKFKGRPRGSVSKKRQDYKAVECNAPEITWPECLAEGVRERVEGFHAPQGYEVIPRPQKAQSLVWFAGVRVRLIETNEIGWICLANASCATRMEVSAYSGSTSNWSRHLQDVHKLRSERSERMGENKRDTSNNGLESAKSSNWFRMGKHRYVRVEWPSIRVPTEVFRCFVRNPDASSGPELSSVRSLLAPCDLRQASIMFHVHHMMSLSAVEWLSRERSQSITVHYCLLRRDVLWTVGFLSSPSLANILLWTYCPPLGLSRLPIAALDQVPEGVAGTRHDQEVPPVRLRRGPGRAVPAFRFDGSRGRPDACPEPAGDEARNAGDVRGDEGEDDRAASGAG